MRCESCGDLVPVAVVDVSGNPVAGCGLEGVLSMHGQVVPSVGYYTVGQRGQRVVNTLVGANVKQGYSAATTMRDVEPLLRRMVR